MARYKYATFGELIWKLERTTLHARNALIPFGVVFVAFWMFSPLAGGIDQSNKLTEQLTFQRYVGKLVVTPMFYGAMAIVFTAAALFRAVSLAKRLSHKRAMIVAGLCECCKHTFGATPNGTVCPVCNTPRESISNMTDLHAKDVQAATGEHGSFAGNG